MSCCCKCNEPEIRKPKWARQAELMRQIAKEVKRDEPFAALAEHAVKVGLSGE